jgi:hypothetical protein
MVSTAHTAADFNCPVTKARIKVPLKKYLYDIIYSILYLLYE